MNKFYDKQFAAAVGHEATLEIALTGSALVAEVEAMNAIRRAQGRPSLEEQDEIDRKEAAQLIAELGTDGLTPHFVAWALGLPAPEDEEPFDFRDWPPRV
ncbi:hypothetical protein [Paraburkholderia bannensis]|uniref:hypothetical protein n=1 Tax=Paraburkholderia bannensis TaxID=765414 RepID=UPI002AC3507F|nr:hypothetical protein [Paraburkholderia bannensis]